MGNPTRRPVSAWGMRWGTSRPDGVISILIYVRAAFSKRYSLTVLPSACKQISLRQETYSPDASPSPQQRTWPFAPPTPTACSPTPGRKLWVTKAPAHHLRHHPSKKLTRSVYASTLPSGNLLSISIQPPRRKSAPPSPPFYIQAPLPLLLPRRPPRPETY